MEAKQLKLLFARANAFKEGDLSIGGTTDELLRTDARNQISAMKIEEIQQTLLVEDQLSELLARSIDRQKLRFIGDMRIAELKQILLGAKAEIWLKSNATALSSESIAAVVKTMNNSELSQVALSLFNPIANKQPVGIVTIGSPGHFGSRIQPNSPGDDEDEILISTLEALCYGCGDVIIGLNPAGDDLETIVRTEKLLQNIVERLQLPTRYCVLSDMNKQKKAAEFTRVDVGFQSLAGTSTALTGMLGGDVDLLLELCRSFNGLYFETGQGSEVTNGAAEGIDMLTLESRCYGLARHIKKETGKWMILNDVAGFIGPEVFKTGEQLKRTCLEDTVMAKLHGLTMGLDICSTFHMGIHPKELGQLTQEIVSLTAPTYLMSVAGKADPMLGYLTTSFREQPRLRKANSKQITSVMQKRLIDLNALKSDGTIDPTQDRIAMLYARFHKEGGEKRSSETLVEEGKRKIMALQQRGYDLGYDAGTDNVDPVVVTDRLNKMFNNARIALYAKTDPAVIRDCCPEAVSISTASLDRDDYLAHPSGGEKIAESHLHTLMSKVKQSVKSFQVQLVVSDGLNADAVNEHLRNVLPAFRWNLTTAGITVCPTDVIIENGRVRAGYHLGKILQPELLVHFIGERPGTGLNQLSAYLTYGTDKEGHSVYQEEMDHSLTTAVCGIHPQGKSYQMAVDELVRLVLKALENKCTGVKLGVSK